MKIQEFGLTRLLNNQHLTFHREFEALIEESETVKEAVASPFAAYQKAVEAEDVSMMKVTKSAITEKKVDADADRDRKLTASFDVIRLAQRHYDAEMQAAGARLSVLLSTYVGSDKAEYNDETGRVRNYIQDVRSSKYAADATKIGLTPWMDVLEEANERCVTLADEYNTEQRDKNAAGVASDLRKNTDAAYRTLVDHLNALALIAADVDTDDLVSRWNTRIDFYRNTVSRRLSGKSAASKAADSKA